MPAPFGPEQADDLARLNGQGHVVERDGGVEAARHVLDDDRQVVLPRRCGSWVMASPGSGVVVVGRWGEQGLERLEVVVESAAPGAGRADVGGRHPALVALDHLDVAGLLEPAQVRGQVARPWRRAAAGAAGR